MRRARVTRAAASLSASRAVDELGRGVAFVDAMDRALEILDENGYRLSDDSIDAVEGWIGDRLSKALGELEKP